jgi:Tfp pilus assembly protein PilF
MTPTLLLTALTLAQWPFTAPAPATMPVTKLTPAASRPQDCLLHYRISTSSPECQQFFDQGLGCLYSYIWMESARAFETATKHDPNCAMAWWGLSRALENWGRGDATKALLKAKELMDRASYPERQLITARLQEKGLWPNVGNQEERRRAAARTLDDLLTVHDDDEEAWFARAQLAVDRSGRGYLSPIAAGPNTLFGGDAASVPYYKALLRLNPLHPGANHELVHYYENAGRPALGWLYSEKYIESSPGLPHAWHMQAHLATRLGRWNKATTSSLKAAELERTYNTLMKIKPPEDHQFSHQLEILMLCLTHDGRYTEARALKKECEGYGFRHLLPWFRLHLAERDFDTALKIADEHRKHDKTTASYLTALIHLARHESAQALAEIEVLEQAYQERPANREVKYRLLEVRGCWLCQTGCPDAGLNLLARVVNETKDDYRHHAWGNGAYYMETWGLAALSCGKFDIAEEAFLEALAHDSGSVRGALGLQTLCERQGRLEEAQQYAVLAKRFWKQADTQAFQAEQAAIRGLSLTTSGTAGN